MNATTTATKLDTLTVGTLILNPVDGVTYRRTGNHDWYDGSDAANWRSSGPQGGSGTVGSAELRLLQLELDRGTVAIIWQP